MLSRECVNFIKNTLSQFSCDNKVREISLMQKPFPQYSMYLSGNRFTLSAVSSCVYRIHLDVYCINLDNEIYNVLLEAHVVEMHEVNGRLRWKRDIEPSKISVPLGILSYQDLAQQLCNYASSLYKYCV